MSRRLRKRPAQRPTPRMSRPRTPCCTTFANGAGPLREGKLTTWEGGVREPGIVRWPGKVPAGRVCDVNRCPVPTKNHARGVRLRALRPNGVLEPAHGGST